MTQVASWVRFDASQFNRDFGSVHLTASVASNRDSRAGRIDLIIVPRPIQRKTALGLVRGSIARRILAGTLCECGVCQNLGDGVILIGLALRSNASGDRLSPSLGGRSLGQFFPAAGLSA